MKRFFALLILLLLTAALASAETVMEVNETVDAEKLVLTVGDSVFTARLCENETARALISLLPMTLPMSELNGNEKYHYLMDALPTQEEAVGQIEPGDIMLFGDRCVVLFYARFTTGYRYTRIGQIEDAAGLQEALGGGDITVRFSMP